MHSCVWEAESSRSWLPEHAQRLRAVSVPPSGSPSALSPPIPRPSLRPCLRRRDRALGAVRLHPGIWWPGVVLFSWLKLGAGGFPPPRYTGLRTTARAGLDVSARREWGKGRNHRGPHSIWTWDSAWLMLTGSLPPPLGSCTLGSASLDPPWPLPLDLCPAGGGRQLPRLDSARLHDRALPWDSCKITLLLLL